MAAINYLYRSTKPISTLNLRLLYRYNNEDYVIGSKTKLEVSKAYWSKQHTLKRVKDIDLIHKQTNVNKELKKIESFILTAFNNANPEYINKVWLESQIEQYYNPPELKKLPIDLIRYVDTYIELKKNNLTPNTIKKFGVIKNKLKRFQDFRKKVILIKDVNLEFKTEFENYCLSELYAPNTIARDIRFIKSFCNHAKYQGIETSYQLEKVKSKYIKVESIYLTSEEIEQIEKTQNLNDHLDNARDWLLISCYTGQRISDFMRFTKEMIRYEQDKPLLEFTQQKTSKLMTVPLSSKVMAILNKRNGEFPHAISDQRYNDYIKDVCKEAEVNDEVKGSKKVETEPGSKKYRKETRIYPKHELVSSHIGRRSFATNNYGKIPTSFLKYVTGHSTESMFLAYIGKSNKDMALELSNYLG